MNARLLYALFSMLVIAGHAQSFDWVRSGGSTGTDKGYGIDADASGNSYVTGVFEGTITLGAFTLTSAGGLDVFVAKYNNNGIVLWAFSEGGAGNDEAFGIGCDQSGNFAITGIYSGTPLFGTTTLSASSGYFLAYYDASGNFQWAREFGSAAGGYAWDVDLDPFGRPVVTGYFNGTQMFGTTSLTSAGLKEGFVLRYDMNGNFNWAVSMGGTADDVSYAINTDLNGNIFVTGRFAGTASFGASTYTSSGGNDVFLSKLDSLGIFQWTAIGGSCPGDDSGQGVDTDAQGNVSITGYVALGTSAFGSVLFNSNGMTDCFVARYNSAGLLLWAKNFGGSGNDYGSDLCLSVSGAIFVTGYFSDSVTIGNTTLNSNGGRDVLIMRIDIAGNPQYALSGGGTADEYGRSVAAFSGFVFIAGPYSGNGTYSSYAITNNGAEDIFVARIKDNEVGIHENVSGQVIVYPNPSADVLHIQQLNPRAIAAIRIYNSAGQLVLSEEFEQAPDIIIDISILVPGEYVMEICNGDVPITHRKLTKL